LTVRWLSKTWDMSKEDDGGVRLVVCTGERMETLVSKLYGKAGLKTTTFEIKHAKGLSNEFRCYASFECDLWKWA
jgi:EEF1A lysine methyltransferase 1